MIDMASSSRLDSCSTAALSLNSALDAYNGGIEPSKRGFAAVINIRLPSNRIGFGDALESSMFTSADSKCIVHHVKDSVGMSTPRRTNNYGGERNPLFDAAELTSIVGAYLAVSYTHLTLPTKRIV